MTRWLVKTQYGSQTEKRDKQQHVEKAMRICYSNSVTLKFWSYLLVNKSLSPRSHASENSVYAGITSIIHFLNRRIVFIFIKPFCSPLVQHTNIREVLPRHTRANMWTVKAFVAKIISLKESRSVKTRSIKSPRRACFNRDLLMKRVKSGVFCSGWNSVQQGWDWHSWARGLSVRTPKVR